MSTTKAAYLRQLADNPTASVGYMLAAHIVYAVQYGAFQSADSRTPECEAIYKRLQARYGEVLGADEMRAEVEAAKRIRA